MVFSSMLSIELSVSGHSGLADLNKIGPVSKGPREQGSERNNDPKSAADLTAFITVQMSHDYFLLEVLRPSGARQN